MKNYVQTLWCLVTCSEFFGVTVILTQKKREVAARAQSIRKHIHLHLQAMSQSRAAKSHTVA